MPKPKKTTTKKSSQPAARKTAGRGRAATPSAPAKQAAAAAPVKPAGTGSRKKNYSKTELNHFRQIILEKKKEILEELRNNFV